eukprot:1146430-Rhodomonas_salina.1
MVLLSLHCADAFLPLSVPKLHRSQQAPSIRSWQRPLASRKAPRVASPSMVQVNDEQSTRSTDEAAKEGNAFVWTKNWYPVAGLIDLDPEVPNERWILGRKI